MGRDIPLGKIAGIRVGIDLSVFLFAAFVLLWLATIRPATVDANVSSGAYWGLAVVGVVFFYVSLLLHELGHALVARDEGIGVAGMSLNLFGGVTHLESTPTNPGAEFRVAVVGPLASAACGVVFLGGAYLLPDTGTWGLAGFVFALAGLVNLILAVTNLIPAAPLDGGKVLSSVIWRATGDQSAGLTWSGAVGIAAGMVLFTWGFRQWRDTSGLVAIYIMVLGAFIAWGAFSQLRAAPLYRALQGRSVRDAMAAAPPSAPAWTTVSEFLRSASPQPEHQAYPVIGPDGRVSGLLTAAAIRAVPPQSWEHLEVATLAYPFARLTLLHPDEDLLPALQKLEGADVATGLVVASDGRILGTLDPSALDRALALARADRQAGGV